MHPPADTHPRAVVVSPRLFASQGFVVTGNYVTFPRLKARRTQPHFDSGLSGNLYLAVPFMGDSLGAVVVLFHSPPLGRGGVSTL